MIKNYRTVHRFRLPSVQEEVSGVHPNNAMGVELKGKSEKEKNVFILYCTSELPNFSPTKLSGLRKEFAKKGFNKEGHNDEFFQSYDQEGFKYVKHPILLSLSALECTSRSSTY